MLRYGIKLEVMSFVQSIALDETYLYMEECQEKEKLSSIKFQIF